MLSAVDMMSMTLAPKLAIYNEPRDSSSAISEAVPPIATTEPKTGGLPDAAKAGREASAKVTTKCPRERIGADGLITWSKGAPINDPNRY